MTYIATLVALFVSWRFLSSLQRLSKFWRISLALLLALNPIAVLCFFSGYVDGSLVSILLSSFMMMLLFVQEKEKQQRLRYGIYIFVLLILLINIKFTGVVYGGVLGVTALLYGWAQKVKWQRILHLAGIGAVAVIFGMIVFGFFPYTTNTIKNKDPFYSAFRIDKQGKKQNQIDHFLSDDFNKHTRFGKTWISLFSKPSKKKWFRAEPLPPFSSIRTRKKIGNHQCCGVNLKSKATSITKIDPRIPRIIQAILSRIKNTSVKHSSKAPLNKDPNPYKKEEERLIELKGGRGSALNHFFF